MKSNIYWNQIQKLGAEIFGSYNLEVLVNTRYNFADSEIAGKGVGVGVSMPIYSKRDKLSARTQARDFLEHGSALIKEFRESISNSEITFMECQLLESVKREYGVEGVKAAFDCKRRLSTLELTIEQKERDIRSMLDPYQKIKETNDKIKLTKD